MISLSFKSSRNLFLCCWIGLFPSPNHVLSDLGLPWNPSKFHRFFNCISIDFWTPNDSQNGFKITTKRSFNPDWNPTPFFSHFGTPNGSHKPRKHQYYSSKTTISTNLPFAFWSSFWHQKVSQNKPKTTLKPLKKPSRKHIKNQHQNW